MSQAKDEFKEAVFGLILVVSDRLLAGASPKEVRAHLVAQEVDPMLVDKVFDEVRPSLVKAFEQKASTLRWAAIVGGISGVCLWFLGQSGTVSDWLALFGLFSVGLAAIFFVRGGRHQATAIRLNQLDW